MYTELSVAIPIPEVTIYSVSEVIQTSKNMPEKKPFERLSKDVIPVNYNLKLQPDLEKFTFDGSVVVATQARINIIIIRLLF